jgi:hypothetical protein
VCCFESADIVICMHLFIIIIFTLSSFYLILPDNGRNEHFSHSMWLPMKTRPLWAIAVAEDMSTAAMRVVAPRRENR